MIVTKGTNAPAIFASKPFLLLRNLYNSIPLRRMDVYAIPISPGLVPNRFPMALAHMFLFQTCRGFLGGVGKMVIEIASHDWRDRKIREWLLLLLRFAVTRELADHSAVLRIADELDSLGLWWRPAAPSFFRRTSEEVCAAISVPSSASSGAILQRHIARINDLRLRRTFAAAVDLQLPLEPQQQKQAKKRKHANFWKGLNDG